MADAVHSARSPLREADIRTSIRPTFATVDRGALASNARVLREAIGAVRLRAVVKADAYGHGAVHVARTLEPLCDGLAVSLAEEGLELRAAGLSGDILVLGAFYDQQHEDVIAARLTPVLYDRIDVDRFADGAARLGRRAAIHVKVDTGMNRIGVSLDGLSATLEQIARRAELQVTGLCTHFSSADCEDVEATTDACRLFDRAVEIARTHGLVGLELHAANSAGAIRFADARYDCVRPGLALYGALPSKEVVLPGLRPVMSLTTRVMAVHPVEVGGTVSYGRTWRASRPSIIATLPVGYADGYPRHVSGASVLVRGVRAPIVGVVCMDMMMVDVTEIPGVAVHDPVTLLGAAGDQAITIDDLASWAGTINYEVLCGISKRVPRHVVG